MVTVKLDGIEQAISRLTNIEQRQVPFAMSLALNRTAEEIQTAQRGELRSNFTIRRPWVEQGVKIARQNRSTKEKLSVSIEIDPSRSFLTKFEAGGTKTPRGRSITVPHGAKRNKSDVIQKGERPRSFQFVQAASSLKTRTTIYKGLKRTFMIQRPDGSGLILRRMGRRGKGPAHSMRDPRLKVLYILTPSAQLKPSLEFYSTGRRIAGERFMVNMNGFLAHAISTAR